MFGDNLGDFVKNKLGSKGIDTTSEPIPLKEKVSSTVDKGEESTVNLLDEVLKYREAEEEDIEKDKTIKKLCNDINEDILQEMLR